MGWHQRLIPFGQHLQSGEGKNDGYSGQWRFFGNKAVFVGGEEVPYIAHIEANTSDPSGALSSDDTDTFVRMYHSGFDATMRAAFGEGQGHGWLGTHGRQDEPLNLPLDVPRSWQLVVTSRNAFVWPDGMVAQVGVTRAAASFLSPGMYWPASSDWQRAVLDPPTMHYTVTQEIWSAIAIGDAFIQVGFTGVPEEEPYPGDAMDDVAFLGLLVHWWTDALTPPVRQFPREDGLGASSARRHFPPTKSTQGSHRWGAGSYD